jgi:hypothetical protein
MYPGGIRSHDLLAPASSVAGGDDSTMYIDHGIESKFYGKGSSNQHSLMTMT